MQGGVALAGLGLVTGCGTAAVAAGDEDPTDRVPLGSRPRQHPSSRDCATACASWDTRKARPSHSRSVGECRTTSSPYWPVSWRASPVDLIVAAAGNGSIQRRWTQRARSHRLRWHGRSSPGRVRRKPVPARGNATGPALCRCKSGRSACNCCARLPPGSYGGQRSPNDGPVDERWAPAARGCAGTRRGAHATDHSECHRSHHRARPGYPRARRCAVRGRSRGSSRRESERIIEFVATASTPARCTTGGACTVRAV